MTLAFIAEHSLSLSLAPELIEYAKEMSTNPKAPESTSMDRTSPPYKMQYGLKDTIVQGTVEELKNTPSSLSIDEAMSKSNKKKLAILGPLSQKKPNLAKASSKLFPR